MKRDIDVIRKILIAIEAHQSANPLEVDIEDSSKEEIQYHLYLMIDGGLLEGTKSHNLKLGMYTANPTGMTWQGHEFLDACRDDGHWGKAKEIALKAKGFSIDIIKNILVNLITEEAKNL